jgi:hypothetical protein
MLERLKRHLRARIKEQVRLFIVSGEIEGKTIQKSFEWDLFKAFWNEIFIQAQSFFSIDFLKKFSLIIVSFHLEYFIFDVNFSVSEKLLRKLLQSNSDIFIIVREKFIQILFILLRRDLMKWKFAIIFHHQAKSFNWKFSRFHGRKEFCKRGEKHLISEISKLPRENPSEEKENRVWRLKTPINWTNIHHSPIRMFAH